MDWGKAAQILSYVKCCVTIPQRLQGFQSVAQQIGIERAHQMEVAWAMDDLRVWLAVTDDVLMSCSQQLLHNSQDYSLTAEDEELLREVSDYICRLR